MSAKKPQPDNAYAVNRQARHDYHIDRTLEAGLMLKGAEAKSIRAHNVNLKDSYVRFDRRGELWLINMHVSAYQKGPQADGHEPTRRRKLLLHAGEIDRLRGEAQAQGYTIVPLKLYGTRGLIKVQIGLAKGKKLYDKREDKKKKDLDREARREAKGARFRS